MGRKPQVSWSPRAVSPRSACHKDLRHLEATARPPCPCEVQQGQTSRLAATWRQCSDGRPDSREERATQSQSGTWDTYAHGLEEAWRPGPVVSSPRCTQCSDRRRAAEDGSSRSSPPALHFSCWVPVPSLYGVRPCSPQSLTGGEDREVMSFHSSWLCLLLAALGRQCGACYVPHFGDPRVRTCNSVGQIWRLKASTVHTTLARTRYQDMTKVSSNIKLTGTSQKRRVIITIFSEQERFGTQGQHILYTHATHIHVFRPS